MLVAARAAVLRWVGDAALSCCSSLRLMAVLQEGAVVAAANGALAALQ